MNISKSLPHSFFKSVGTLTSRKDILYSLITVLALIAFEGFNYSTTDFALSDLLGDLRFAGIRWSTLLSIAFCAIDFAGIARLFAPQSADEETRKVWFMFGAWILAAVMNAILTWWGVVMAMQTHPVLSAGLVNEAFVNRVVPIFIALMVWLIRILLIGTLSRRGEHLLRVKPSPPEAISRREFRQAQSKAAQAAQSVSRPSMGSSGKSVTGKPGFRPEPTYIPMQSEVAYHSLKSHSSSRR